MGKTIILFALLMLLPMIAAAPSYFYQQDTSPILKISCFDLNSSLCNSDTDCYVTINKPKGGGTFLKNALLNFDVDEYNYTLPVVDTSGEYSVVARCEGNTTGFSTFTFEVTPTGKPQTSILDNPTLLFFSFLAMILVFMGVYLHNPWFGFIGSIMFILGGIYTMIYGFNNVTDLYTRGIAITFIGLGFVFMFTAAYEWIWGEKE